MKIQLGRPKLLYPTMVIAAISVTIFSLLGIATLTGALPSAHSEVRDATAAETRVNNNGLTTPKKITGACPKCGAGKPIRAVQLKGDSSIRTLDQSEVPGISAGERVKIVDGNILQQS